MGTAILGKIENMWGRKMPIFISLLVIGIDMIVLGVAPIYFGPDITRIIATVTSFAMGILIVVIAVTARTVLQTNTREDMHGRIFSFLDVIIAFATPIPVLVTGLLADRVSILATLIIFGGIVISLTYFGHKIILRK